ncbi:hypothetical protein F2P81_004715 [Scophthalmus maximus]|uniref:Uncharacterized protein n=1 Tax=Scophthalmus maximus TaxID=52904 RepID=A0A6A4TG17_SCOMX|nr:hypothetical protein F2P81_004715 [Scophthalmus maximus]
MGEETDIIRQQGERERGRDWREREKDSITREKQSVVFSVLEERFRAEVESQAHSLENMSPARNKLDFKKRECDPALQQTWTTRADSAERRYSHLCH